MNTKRRPGRYEEQPTERACKSCTVLKPIASFQERNTARNGGRPTYRYSCFDCESAKALARYHELKNKGACSHCGQPPMEGFGTCESCYIKNKMARDSAVAALRELVLSAYGRKCSHCKDPCIGCLEIDHVGGWGKEHKDSRGRRLQGYGLWVWIRDNGFPATLRLLCGSCHSSLSYRGELPKVLPSWDLLK
jgi:hypothetical protein